MPKLGQHFGQFSMLGLCAAGLLCGGCETFYPPVSFVPAKKFKDDAGSSQTGVFESNANRRFAYIVPKPDGKGVSVYSEPPPDTALQSVTDLSGKITIPSGASPEAKAVITQTILDLTHRTQAVVILRDSLFRLAEAASNGVITEPAYSAEFDKVVEAAKVVALADEERAKADLAKSTALQNASESVRALTTSPQAVKDPETFKRTLQMLQELRVGGDGTGPR